MFLGQQVRADDLRLATTYRHFRRNLEDICRAAAVAGAQTILCTVGTNLRDCPPFASLHRLDLTPEQLRNWNAAYQEGVIAETQGNRVEAIAAYRRAAEIDDSYAELPFRLGRCQALMGEYEQAREQYVKARDLDTLRFRADTQINRIIQNVADGMKSKGVVLANVEDTLKEASPNRLPGRELFCEHVHLTFSGNHAIAATCCLDRNVDPGQTHESLVRGRQAGGETSGVQPWSRQETLDTLIHGFLEKPPFTNQLDHKEQVEELRRQLQELRIALTPEPWRQSLRIPSGNAEVPRLAAAMGLRQMLAVTSSSRRRE